MKRLIVFLILLCATVCGMTVQNGATSVITYFVLRDQTAGTVDTGVTLANIDMYYVEEQAAISGKIDAAAHGAATDAWTSGEVFHCGFGVYRIDWPDAAFDSGIGKKVQLIVIDGDGGAFTEILEVELSPPTNVITIEGTDATDALDSAAETGADASLVTVNLDHLLKTTTGVAAGGDLTNHVADQTILSHILSNANTSDYGSDDDSLVVLSDNLDAVLVDTAAMDTAGEWDTLNATVVTAVGNIETDTAAMDTAGEWDTLNATVVTAVGNIETDTAAMDTNSEMKSLVWSSAMVDMTAGEPAYDANALHALNWIYQAWRNKTVTTATEVKLYKDNASTIATETTISDSGTAFTKGEYRAE